MKSDFIDKTACRICSRAGLVPVLDLGVMPPANAFLKEGDLRKPEQKFPLVLCFCPKCGLAQLSVVVDPAILFRHYDYFTSASAPLAEHFIRSADNLVKRFIKSKNDLVLEIGGNDGVLLASVLDRCRALNIEPAENIAAASRERGVETLNEFFSSSLAGRILKTHGKARLIVAHNVIAHVDDVSDVFLGVKSLLADEGAFVLEVHWVGNLIGDGGFDQIYHEHLSYFSLGALQYLARSLGLEIFDAELIPIHGQSLRVYIGQGFDESPSIGEILKKEKNLGLDTAKPFFQFAKRVEKSRRELYELLSRLKKEGKTIAGYGAPAKGNTLLNYFGIDNKLMDFITDTTPAKQGLFTPGSHIPIRPPETISKKTPDYMVLLAWNYADAIVKKESGFRERGGKFIIPVPEVKII